MQHYLRVQENLRARPKRWLITGVAGFVGSNLLEHLLNLDQEVVGIDNLSVGSSKTLLDVKASVSAKRWSRFSFRKADITSFVACQAAMKELQEMTELGQVDYVLHHAGLNSQSADSSEVNRVNVCGFLNVLEAAQESQVKRVVYASSSPANHLTQPAPSSNTYLNELHATTCHRDNNSKSEMTTISLRYQNVFGKRQANHSSNPALVPYWIEQLIEGEQCTLYGSKNNRKDFVHIDDVVQANILAAVACDAAANQCYDITSGYYMSLEELFDFICKAFDTYYPELTVNSEAMLMPSYIEQTQDTQIDISKAIEYLKFQPNNTLAYDVATTISWYHRAYMEEILTHA